MENNYPHQSSETAKLIEAWCKASLEFKPFMADKKGNYGPYVSIDAMKLATKEALCKYSIKLTQGTYIRDGAVVVVTKIAHANQWEEYLMYVKEPVNARLTIDQAYGSSFSYQRRYALYALFGIKGEDLDPDGLEPEESLPIPSSTPASEKQVKFLESLIGGRQNYKKLVLDTHGLEDLSGLSSSQCSTWIKWMQERDKKE